jgi:lysozyme
MTTEPGIDVAWPQGSFNWNAEKNKIAFGMCKATEGTGTTDPDFVHNWNGMWALNKLMPRFAYHFFHASEDPIAQAEKFVSLVKPHGLLAGDNLVLDLEPTETDGSNDKVAPATVAARARTFLNTANELAPNHRVLVYTNPGFAETGACAGLGAWYLWVAHYGVSKPTVPSPWKTWTFWQKSDNGLDLDVYNGTEAELLAFTRMPKTR